MILLATTDVARETIEHAKWQYNHAQDASWPGLLVLAIGAVIAIVFLRRRVGTPPSKRR
jgi:hypothetical protein